MCFWKSLCPTILIITNLAVILSRFSLDHVKHHRRNWKVHSERIKFERFSLKIIRYQPEGSVCLEIPERNMDILSCNIYNKPTEYDDDGDVNDEMSLRSIYWEGYFVYKIIYLF